ncbi:spore coat protein GerQ [Fictibacillus aquaticus]|uniref:Spore coat protein GerQ n=1 Tax=Fictibacillus aquaticus TaxID=2021314 RepID=A0A235F8J6_9BACL|nr:spore coat protein GerQ [Fictibacillus aquaticus]OYD57363.1 spore coat protein GerQ [Fictibacillus aquaticus]
MSYWYYPYYNQQGFYWDVRPNGQQQQQAGYGVPPQMAQSQQAPGAGYTQQMPDYASPGQLPLEQSYIENILRMNKGQVATVYMTFENNEKWNAKIFKGIIEAAGRDHIILSDPQTGKRYLLLMVYVNYITFDNEIEYSYPYNGGQQQSQQGQQMQQMTSYSPR